MVCLCPFVDFGLDGEQSNVNFGVGDVVYVNGDLSKKGKICYVGEVAFAKGEFAGIVLDKPVGKFRKVEWTKSWCHLQ